MGKPFSRCINVSKKIKMKDKWRTDCNITLKDTNRGCNILKVLVTV